MLSSLSEKHSFLVYTCAAKIILLIIKIILIPDIQIEIGDYIAIHDTGAHGFAMGYNYNGKLKSAELLLQEDGGVRLIRRAETPKDYFATFDCFEIFDKLFPNK